MSGLGTRLFALRDRYEEYTRAIASERDAWRGKVVRYFADRGYTDISIREPNRVTARHIGKMDQLSIVHHVSPSWGRVRLSKMRAQFSAWRQIARTLVIKEELKLRSCHPSRIPQI